jgi:hypothetical protein
MQSSLIERYAPIVLNRLPSVYKKLVNRHALPKSMAKKFVLSFDCDANDDAKVAPRITKKLIEMGITPVFAVPGQLLLRNIADYTVVRDLGCQFMNHGFRQHTFKNMLSPVWKSSFFYEKVPFCEVKNDIRLADEVLTDFLGTQPVGFRAPHFGTCQTVLPEIYEILFELGYTYSSSGAPVRMAEFGYVYSLGGIIEFPTAGGTRRCCNCLDSYNSVILSNDSNHYFTEVEGLVESDVPFINLYVDPSHVVESSGFWSAMELLLTKYNATNYTELLSAMNKDGSFPK